MNGLGQELGGEGLMGLTRAFQYAGAHSIMASQWAISDAATAADETVLWELEERHQGPGTSKSLNELYSRTGSDTKRSG